MDTILRRIDQGAVGFAVTLVANCPALFLTVLSGGLVARSALPVVAGALSSGATPLWSASRTFYPFFIVNLIIFVIWKLSDWKQHGAAEEKPPEDGNLVTVKSSDVNPIEPFERKTSQETWEECPAVAAVVPVTMLVPQYVEFPPASGKPAVCSKFGTKIAIPMSGLKVAEEDVPPLEDAGNGEVTVEEDEEENPPMEVMWKAIMEKKSRETAAAWPPTTPPRGQKQQESMAERPLHVLKGREASTPESRDESNDFIRKQHNHNQ